MPAVLEALYRAFWVERNSKVGEPEGFAPVLESVLGKQGTEEVLSAVSC
jgi:2-hydroxychromene-2-carboxylate isomerase